MSSIPSTGVSAAAMPSIDPSMSVETIMIAVQKQRASLLQAQLIDQVKQVQAGNDHLSKLNIALNGLNKAAAMCNADGNDPIGKDNNYAKDNSALEREVNTALIDAGITNPGLTSDDEGGGGLTNRGDKRLKGGLRADVKKQEIDTLINNIKGQIDEARNASQIDLLRLQALSNKRNEAYDLMTHFIKKSQDSNGSIINSLR